MVGRLDRSAQGVDAGGDHVVGVHGLNRLRLERLFADHHTLFSRRGRGGLFPNLTKAFMIWLPSDERTRAQAIMWLSARWAGAFTPLLVIWVMSTLRGGARSCCRIIRCGLGDCLYFSFVISLRLHGAATFRNSEVPWQKLISSRTVLAALDPIFLSDLRLVFLRHLAADLFEETRGLALDQNAFMLCSATRSSNF